MRQDYKFRLLPAKTLASLFEKRAEGKKEDKGTSHSLSMCQCYWQYQTLLLLDNCSVHPDEKSLVSEDDLITAKFLPPNVTSLIKPMDQGVLESLKRRYRKSLLRDILLGNHQDILYFLKSVNMKTVVKKVALAWEEISPVTTIRHS